jgi:hypothetical protein
VTPGNCPPQQVNDECTGATAVAVGINGPFNAAVSAGSAAATTSVPPSTCPAGGMVADLWYSFLAPATAPFTFKTCGQSTDNTVIALYYASAGCSSLVPMACDNDSCGLQSSATANLTGGATYYVRVGGLSVISTFSLEIHTGTAGGAITSTTTLSPCRGSSRLTTTGYPNIGGAITMSVTGVSGLPMVGYGFPAFLPIPLPCGCSIISDGAGNLGTFFFAPAPVVLPIPFDPYLVGVSFHTQGIVAFPTSGGCVFSGIPFAATHIDTVAIG